MSKSTTTTGGAKDAMRVHEFALEAARLCKDDKCEHVLVLDVREHSQIADFLVIASGTSDRQMRAVLDHIAELGESLGFDAFRTNADPNATWLLTDFVDIIVHLFEPNTRAYYDLETLWSDAPRIDWRRDGDDTHRTAAWTDLP